MDNLQPSPHRPTGLTWLWLAALALALSIVACGGGGGGGGGNDDDDDDSVAAECGNNTLDAGEQCDGAPGCGSDCRCGENYTPVGAGGCEAINVGDFTPEAAESVALASVDDIQFQQTTEGMAQPDDYLRGYLRGKMGRGAAKRMSQALEIGDLPACAHIEDVNCCSPDDPCGWANDQVCDCEGTQVWDEGDCGSSVECCSPDDPCGWAADGVCDCEGTMDWDIADCVPTDCCDPSDPCGWANDGMCDCQGAMEWDIADCNAGECCDPSDPCMWADDGYCDCEGTQAWDEGDCAAYAECCDPANPCDWADDGWCDCEGTMEWDINDCSVVEVDCCDPSNPCGWEEDGICDCEATQAWDEVDCSTATNDDCCSESDPCGWASDGVCDCGGSTAWDTDDCAGTDINSERFTIVFEPGCRVGDDVLEGRIHVENYEYNQEGYSYEDQFVGFEEFFANGDPVKGEIYTREEAFEDETCVGSSSYVEYFDFSSPMDGYIDGSIDIFDGECLYEGGDYEAYKSYEFDNFIFGGDIIGISYTYYAFTGYLDIELRITGTRGGVPVAGYYDYTETDLGDGNLQIEGAGRNFSSDAGGEVTLDYLYTQARDLCGQVPLDGYMNMTIGGEQRQATFECDDLIVE